MGNSDSALVSTPYQPGECQNITRKDQYGHRDVPTSDDYPGPTTQTDLGRR